MARYIEVLDVSDENDDHRVSELCVTRYQVDDFEIRPNGVLQVWFEPGSDLAYFSPTCWQSAYSE